MDETKEVPPFGYTFDTFDADLIQASPEGLSNGGQTLLNENENRTLLDFFTNTNYLYAEASASITAAHDSKNSFDHFGWGGGVPPASVHQVSTIADQSQLHRGFHTEHALPSEHHQQPLSAGPFSTNTTHSQPASALFNNDPVHPQPSHSNPRSYSVPNIQHGLSISNSHPPNMSTGPFGALPMVPTPHGMMNEQLAALIPNHSENGSMDEQLAAQFSHAQVQLDQHRHSLKRPFMYGTDNDFNANGYAASTPHVDDSIHQHLVAGLGIAQPLLRAANGEDPQSPTSHFTFLATDNLQEGSDDAQPSLDGASGNETGANKKRRKTKSSLAKDDGVLGSRRKSTSAVRPGKAPKASGGEGSGKKKRHPIVARKSQRTNLSEEQKRSNHIISEQKRRNLIKLGYQDLNYLVPEVLGTGVSKSAVLNAAADFLLKTRDDNQRYSEFIGFNDN